jgi:hypothetical protein
MKIFNLNLENNIYNIFVVECTKNSTAGIANIHDNKLVSTPTYPPK